MTTGKQAHDNSTFRTLEVEIDDAYREIANAQSQITTSLDTDDYAECYSSVVTIMNAIETIRKSRIVIDQLDVDWENL
jgi:hypothetical protein